MTPAIDPTRVATDRAIAAHLIAQEIVASIRARDPNANAPIYLPITAVGSDVRVVIESSPSVVAAAELQTAVLSDPTMQTGTMPFLDAVRAAIDLLLEQADREDKSPSTADLSVAFARRNLLFDITTSLIVGTQNA